MNAAALVDGFAVGLLHPLIVPAHVLALLGLALMISRQTQRRATVLAFGVGLIGGLWALTAGVGETPANTVLLAGAAIAGLGAASGWPVRAVIGAPLAIVIGASIGLDSPPHATSLRMANATLGGTAFGGVAALGVIAAAAARLRRGWPAVGVRVLGSWVAASAILVLALRLPR